MQKNMNIIKKLKILPAGLIYFNFYLSKIYQNMEITQ